MAALSRSVFTGITYGVMGMGTEGGATPYRVTVASKGGWNGTPVGASGYSLGAMQFDFGQRGAPDIKPGKWDKNNIDPQNGKPYVDSLIVTVNDWAQLNNLPTLSSGIRSQLLSSGSSIQWLDNSDRAAITAFGDTEQGKLWVNGHLEKGLIKEYEAKITPVMNSKAFDGWSESDVIVATAVLSKAANQSPNKGFTALVEYVKDRKAGEYTLERFLSDTKLVEEANSKFHFTKAADIAKQYVVLRESSEFGAIIESAEHKIADPGFSPTSIGPDSDLWFMQKVNSDPKFRNDLLVALNKLDANPDGPSLSLNGQAKGRSQILLVPEDDYVEIMAAKGGTSVIVKQSEAYFYPGGDVEGRRNALKAIESAENQWPNSEVDGEIKGHWEDTTQYDALGNVTSPGQRTWVTDSPKLPRNPVSYETVVFNSQVYEVNPNGILERRIPDHPDWLESRDSTGGGIITDTQGNTIALLQKGDHVGQMDDGRISINDVAGKAVDRLVDEAFAGAFATATPANPLQEFSLNTVQNQQPEIASDTQGVDASTTTTITASSTSITNQPVPQTPAPTTPAPEPTPVVTPAPTVAPAPEPAPPVAPVTPTPSIDPVEPVTPVTPVAPVAPTPTPQETIRTTEINTQNADAAAATATTQLNDAVSLVNSLISAGNWNHLSDTQRLSLAAGLYNGISKQIGTVPLIPSEYTAGLGFAAALESGHLGAIGVSGIQLGDVLGLGFTDSIASNLNSELGTRLIGGDIVPGLNVLLAIDSGNPISIISSGLALIPGWGQAAALVFSILGPALFGEDEPPMQVGHVAARWDDSGHFSLQTLVDQGKDAQTSVFAAMGQPRPGAARAHSVLESLTSGLQQALAQSKDASGNPLYELLPGKLPEVGYRLEPGQDNTDRLHLYYTDAQGVGQTRFYDENGMAVAQPGTARFGSGVSSAASASSGGQSDLVRDFLAFSQAAIVPAWVAQAQRQQFTDTVAPARLLEAQLGSLEAEMNRLAPQDWTEGSGDNAMSHHTDSPDAERYAALQLQVGELKAQASGLRADAAAQLQSAPALSDLGQHAVRNADGLHQSLSALSFALPDFSAAVSRVPEGALARPLQTRPAGQVLVNLDADAYLENLNWVASNQALLGIDLNGDGRIDALELLSNQSLDWLDANHDGVIDARDPAFAAIRVWVDVNGDADSRDGSSGRDETSSLKQSGISAINFKTAQGPVLVRADGSRQALEVQKLTGDTLGVSLRVVAGAAGLVQTTEQADGSGVSVLLAANTRAFDNQAGHVHGGEVVSTPAIAQLVNAGDSRLQSTTNRTVANTTVQTTTTLTAGDKRLQQGAAGTLLAGQDSTQQTRHTAAVGEFVSIGGAGGLAYTGLTAAPVYEPIALTPALPRQTVVVGNLGSLVTAPEELSNPAGSVAMALPQATVVSGQVAGVQTVQQVLTTQVTATTGSVTQPPVGGDTADATRAGASVEAAPDVRVLQASQISSGQAAGASSATPVQAVHVAAGDTRITSAPASRAVLEIPVAALRIMPVQITSSPAIAFIPTGPTTLVQQRREITAEMIRSADAGLASLGLGPGGAALMGLALGATASASLSLQANAAATGNAHVEIAEAPDTPANTAAITSADAYFDVYLDVNTSPYATSQNDSVDGTASSLTGTLTTLIDTPGRSALQGDLEHTQPGNADTASGLAVQRQGANTSPTGGDESDVAGDGGGSSVDSVSGLGGGGADSNTNPVGTGQFVDSDSARNNIGNGLGGNSIRGSNGISNSTASTPVVFTSTSTSTPTPTTSTSPSGTSPTEGTSEVSSVAPAGPASTVDIARPVLLGASFDGFEDRVVRLDAAQLLANDRAAGLQGTALPLGGLRLVGVSNAAHGQVALITLPDGSQQVVFTPEADYYGPASFSYTVANAAGGVATATASVQLAEVNDAPVAATDTLVATEDTVLTLSAAQLLGNDLDPDTTNAIRGGAGSVANDVLTLTSVGHASHGTVAMVTVAASTPDGVSTQQVVFTPDANYSGRASFTYTVSDGRGGFSSAEVFLDIAAVNDAPVAVGEVVHGDEDAPLVIAASTLLANDRDIDNPHSDLRIASVGNALHGTVRLHTDGSVRFTPDTDYNGQAGFDYSVSDGAGGISTARATIDIASSNDAPSVQGETIAGVEDTSLPISSAALLANDGDIDSPHANLKITSVSHAVHGSVVLGADGNVRFTPTADYNSTGQAAGTQGPARFDYTVSDGEGGTTTGTATVQIAAVNDAPVTTGEVIDSDEDMPLLIAASSLLANDRDIDNPHSDLRITTVSHAVHGTAVLNADGSVAFDAEANYSGRASFTYTVSDGAGGSTSAGVELNLAAVNDAPVTVGEVITSNEDVPLVIAASSLLANDRDIDNPHSDLHITAVGHAVHGTAVLNADGSVGFTPAADYVGRATFDYTIEDGAGGATQASVAIDLANINDAPRLQNETIASAEDTPIAIDSAALMQNDTDIDNPHASLHITAISHAVHGTALLNADGSVAFTPDADYAGQAGFDYTVSDGDGGVSTATATLQIAAVNDAPVTMGEVIASDEDVPLLITAASLLANDTDIDNPHSDLRVSAVGNAAHGIATMNAAGDVLFTPDADYVGRASFDYTVSDGAGGLTQATVALDLANVNDAPRLQTETVPGIEDTPLTIASATLLANDTDVDNPHSSLSITAVGHGVHGTALLNADGSVSFTPDADYNSSSHQGPASFEYTVSDGVGGITTGTAMVTLGSVNDAPVAQGEVVAPVAEDTILVFSSGTLLANDSDVDRDANNTRDTLTVAQVGHASHGAVALAADGTVTFTPEANYNGQAGFGYTVSDGAGGLAEAAVSLTLTAVNDAPVLQAENLVSDQDAPLLVTSTSLLANDSDVDNPHADLRITAVAGAVHGSVALQTAGASSIVNFTPDAGFKGQASFEYTVSDGAGGVSTAIAQVRVLGVNHAPVAQADVLAAQLEDTNLVIAASALLGNDSDIDISTDGQALHISSVSAISGQTHGVVGLNADGNVTFSPDQDYTGAVRFAYTVTDNASGLTPTTMAKSASSNVSFEITNVNDAPQAASDYIVAKNLAVVNIASSTLLANDRDADLTSAPAAGDHLSVTGVSGAQNGTAVLQADGSVQFVTTPGFHGVAQFTYDISDGNGGSSSAVARVNNFNAAPTVVGESGTVLEDSITTISSSILLANDSDADNAASDLRIVAVTGLGAATHGSVALGPSGDVTYTPDLNYAGAAQFNYTVADGDGGQATGTVSLNVQQVNDAPVATGEFFALQEDQIARAPTSVLLANDTDIETPGALSVVSVSNAQHGVVQLAGDVVTFTPEANFNGSGAGFDYTVSDGQGGLAQAHAAFYYEPINDAPVVNNETFQAVQDTSYTVAQSALLANDTDVETPQSLQISALYGASGATVEFQGPNRDIRFTPTPGFSGNASFKYTVMDAQGATAEGTTTVALARVNHNPTATDDSFVGFEDQQFSIAVSQLLNNDFDQDTSSSGDVLSVTGVSNASAGTVSLTGGTVSFMPNADYAGPAGFSYTVSDGRGGSTSAYAYVTVNQVNDAPVVTGVMYVPGFDDFHFAPGAGDGSETYQPWDNPAKEHGSIQAYDIDGPGALYGYISQQPNYGSATVDSAGSWTYDGYAIAYDGPDQFTIQVSDGIASTAVTISTYHGYVPPSGGGGGGGGGGGDITPIVVDLQGDGVALLRPEHSNVFMDIDGDGLRERLGWAASSDAVLAFDANHDGLINKLEEISFTGYLPGAKTDLEGLRAFDSNADSKLSAADAQWQDFGLLQDKNGNGVQDAGDFILLDKTAVVSISLDRHGSPQKNNGNVVYGTSDAVLKDGTTVQASDASFSAIAWESAGKVVPVVTSALKATATDASHPSAAVAAIANTATTTVNVTTTAAVISAEQVSSSSHGATPTTVTTTTTPADISVESPSSTSHRATTAVTTATTTPTVISVEPISSSSHGTTTTTTTATATTTPVVISTESPPSSSHRATTAMTAASAPLPATTAEVAQMALVFNSYANTATASLADPPLAFVPVTHGASEVVMDLSSLHEAANNTANVLSLPVAATTSTVSLQALA